MSEPTGCLFCGALMNGDNPRMCCGKGAAWDCTQTQRREQRQAAARAWGATVLPNCNTPDGKCINHGLCNAEDRCVRPLSTPTPTEDLHDGLHMEDILSLEASDWASRFRQAADKVDELERELQVTREKLGCAEQRLGSQRIQEVLRSLTSPLRTCEKCSLIYQVPPQAPEECPHCTLVTAEQRIRSVMGREVRSKLRRQAREITRLHRDAKVVRTQRENYYTASIVRARRGGLKDAIEVVQKFGPNYETAVVLAASLERQLLDLLDKAVQPCWTRSARKDD